jgi:hypothetical protein
MSAIITNQFRKNSRELFINDIDTNTNYFIGIGKSEPWPDVGGVEESNLNYSVPLPSNTIIEKTDALKNLISLLKVQSTFTVIPRNEWQSGRVYKVYDPSDPNIFNYETIGATAYYPCYMTHNNKVFICIKNTSPTAGQEGVIVPSTTNVTATGFTGQPGVLTDGYSWAYVCDLTTTSDFYTNQFVDIPDNLTVQTDIDNARTATGGKVYGFKVNNGGTGISAQDITLIGKDSLGAPIADVNIRTGVNDQAPYVVTIVGGVITAITITTDQWPAGYAEASVVVAGVATDIQPLVAPIDGFGFSPRSDLPSFYAGLFAAYVGGADGEAPVGLGFRQVSLVKDATRTDNDVPANDTLNIYDTLPYLQLSSSTGIPTDAGTVIAHATNKAKAYLDYVDTTNDRVYYHQNSSGEINQKPIETGNVTFTSPGGTTTSAYNVSAIVQGEYNQGSGETLFLENRKAILRNNNQQEDIKLVIQF